ncbi:MAG: DUF2125 domain-containing protein [Pseudomonadota bacterium]
MSGTAPKPAYNSARRIKWLAFAVLLVIALYSGGWYFAADRIGGFVDERIDTLAAEGVKIDCPDREVRGFPFRIGLFCSDLDVDAPTEAFALDAGAFRSAAQVYDPTRAVIEVDAPVAINVAGEAVRLNYAVGQAVVAVRAPGRRSLSIELQDGVGAASDVTAEWERLTAFSREAENNLELAIQAVGLTTDAADLPVLNIDAYALIAEASYETTSLRGKTGMLRRFAVRLTDDRGLLANGPFSVSEVGLVDADISVRVIDVPGIVSELEVISPALSAAIGGFLQLQPLGGDNGDEVAFDISVRDGQASIGFIPLGAIPRL